MDGKTSPPVLEQGDTLGLDEVTSHFELEYWGGGAGKWVLIGNGTEYYVDPSQVVVNEVHEIEQ
jgi:hypothetical protein